METRFPSSPPVCFCNSKIYWYTVTQVHRCMDTSGDPERKRIQIGFLLKDWPCSISTLPGFHCSFDLSPEIHGVVQGENSFHFNMIHKSASILSFCVNPCAIQDARPAGLRRNVIQATYGTEVQLLSFCDYFRDQIPYLLSKAILVTGERRITGSTWKKKKQS